MTPSLIEKKLEYIRDQLATISNQDIVFEMDYIEKLMETLRELTTEGLPIPQLQQVNGNDEIQSSHFDDLLTEFNRFLEEMSSTIIDGTVKLNTILSKLNDVINTVSARIDGLEQSVNDAEKKVLEKVVDRSIYDTEMKEIDFHSTINQTNLRITDDNIVTLPVLQSTEVPLSSLGFSIRSPAEVSNPLALTTENTIGVTVLPTGYWMGTFVSMALESLSRRSIVDLYSYINKSSDSFNIQFFGAGATETVMFNLTGNLFGAINEFFIDANVPATLTVGSTAYSLTQNRVFAPIASGPASLGFSVSKQSSIDYNEVDLSPINAISADDTTALNVFESMVFQAGTVDPDLTTLKDQLAIMTGTKGGSATRKYDISTNPTSIMMYEFIMQGMHFSNAAYDTTGTWISDEITTDKRIRGIEITDDVSIPDDTMKYISYFVSFDNIDWYELRSQSSAPMPSNASQPIRIELNTNSTRTDYLILQTSTDYYGFFLKVVLAGKAANETPVIYSVNARVKVDQT
jgi:hypothetical protein